MYVKVNQTRHTAIGTFRRGLVYRVDEKNRRAAATIEPLMAGEGAPLEKITAKQAEKVSTVVIGPQAEGTGAPVDAEGEDA